jgi:hypothetical protein
MKKTLFWTLSILILLLSVWSRDRITTAAREPTPTPTRQLQPVVDSRARRAQVLGLTGSAKPQPAGGLSALAAPPQTATWNVYDHYHFTDVVVDFSLAYTSTYAFYYVDDDFSVPPATLVDVAAAFDANYITTIGNFGNTPKRGFPLSHAHPRRHPLPMCQN